MQDKTKLTKAEIKKLANAMICQTLKCFDSFAFKGADIPDNQIDDVLNEIFKVADKYENDYSNIAETQMIVKAIKEDRKD